MIRKLITTHMLQELLVVGNDNELKILLVTTVVNDLIERNRQCLDVIRVEIRRWFVESNDLFTVLEKRMQEGKEGTYTTVDAETFSKC